MYERILIPTDGSTGTAHVVLQALDLAEQYGASVDALYVKDSDVTTFLTDVDSVETLRERAQEAVGTVERMAEGHGVDVVTESREGDPGEMILAYAEEIDADLIVAGTHGRSGVRRRLLGSVAEQLVRHAQCPVMTVSLPETDVTVEDEQQAREQIERALAEEGYDAEVDSVGRQLSVWVGEAESDQGGIIVYLDPKTQRTSVLPQGG